MTAVEQITSAAVSTRELAHHTSRILERVGRGETLHVTRYGEVVAVIRPVTPEETAYARLVAAGVIRPPRSPRDPLPEPVPVPEEQPAPSEEFIETRESERH